MSVYRLHYVACDVCGTPASEPVDPGTARRRIPPDWVRTNGWVDGSPRKWDLCPTCALRTASEANGGAA